MVARHLEVGDRGNSGEFGAFVSVNFGFNSDICLDNVSEHSLHDWKCLGGSHAFRNGCGMLGAFEECSELNGLALVGNEIGVFHALIL